jgi:hypothetical protein
MNHHFRIIASLAERRDGDRDHIESVVKVLAKAIVPDHRLEIAVRGREYPHVDFDGTRSADTQYLPLLKGSQQLRLHTDIEIADFVQEERSLVRDFEEPFLLRDGAGERPLLMAKELRFEQVLVDRSTVDCLKNVRPLSGWLCELRARFVPFPFQTRRE